MPPRANPKPNALHVGDLVLYQTTVQAAVHEWTLHRIVSFDQQSVKLSEFDPDKPFATRSNDVIDVSWPSSSIAQYQHFSSYSKAQCYALALTGDPSNNQASNSSFPSINQPIANNHAVNHWTTVYYACTIQRNTSKKAQKDRLVIYQSDQSQCIVPSEVNFNQSSNQPLIVPGIIQTTPITADVIRASLIAAGHTPPSPQAVTPFTAQPLGRSNNQSINLGEKRKRDDSSDLSFKIQRTDHLSNPSTKSDHASNQSNDQSINQSNNQSLKLTLKKKPRAWYLPMPSFKQLMKQSNNQTITQFTQPLTSEEADGKQHIQSIKQSINQSNNQSSDLPFDHDGYIDSLGCWHSWDATKPLPSRKLVAAAYCPDLSFK